MTQLPSVMELIVNSTNNSSSNELYPSQLPSLNNNDLSTPITLPPLTARRLTEPNVDNYSVNKRFSVSSSINANSRNPSASNESPNNAKPQVLSVNSDEEEVPKLAPIPDKFTQKSHSTSGVPTVAKSPGVSPGGSSPKDYFNYQHQTQHHQQTQPQSQTNQPQIHSSPHPQYQQRPVPPQPSKSHPPSHEMAANSKFPSAQLTPGVTPGIPPSAQFYQYQQSPYQPPPPPPVAPHKTPQQLRSPHIVLHQSPNHPPQSAPPAPQGQAPQAPPSAYVMSPDQPVPRSGHVTVSPQGYIPGSYMTPGITPGIPPQMQGIPPQMQAVPQSMPPQTIQLGPGMGMGPQMNQMTQMSQMNMNQMNQMNMNYQMMTSQMSPHSVAMSHQMQMVHGVPVMGYPPQMNPNVPMTMGMGGMPVWYDDNHALFHKRRIIKRRTRTGCLTCRKRRIKCDERKPYCFNCERSRKVCLGYENLSKKKESEEENEEDEENEEHEQHDEREQENEQNSNQQEKSNQQNENSNEEVKKDA